MKIVQLVGTPGAEKPDLHDVPLMLRRLADSLEAGKYGDINDPEFIIRCVGVLRVSRREPIVFGFGASAVPAQSYMDLHAGAIELMNMQHPDRE